MMIRCRNALKVFFNKITILLLILFFRLELRKYKKALKLSKFTFLILTYRTRNLLKLKTFGYDSYKDDLVILSISKLLELRLNEKDQKIKKNRLKKIYKICKKIERDELCLKLIDIYAQLRNIYNDRYNLELILKNRPLPNSSLIEDIDIGNLKKVFNILKRLGKVEHKKLVDRTRYRLDFSYSEIGNTFTIITPIIFVGSYFYSIIYYNYFGFDIHNFFSLSDYITAAIKKIGIALMFSVISIISTFLGIVNYSKNTITKSVKSKNKMLEVFFIITLFFYAIIVHVYNIKGKFIYSGMALIPFCYLFGDFLATKYFKPYSLKPIFFFTFILQFYLIILVSAFNDIDNIENNFNQNKSEIFYKPNIDIKNKENLINIGYSDDYVFLYDTINNESISIKKENIQYIKKYEK